MKKTMNKIILSTFAILSLGARTVFADIVSPLDPPFYDRPKHYQNERNSNLLIILGAILIVVAISGIIIYGLNVYKKRASEKSEKIEEPVEEEKIEEVKEEVKEESQEHKTED